MVKPVSSTVFDKGYVTGIVLVNTIVQTKKNAQARLRENCVCRLEKNVIPGDIHT